MGEGHLFLSDGCAHCSEMFINKVCVCAYMGNGVPIRVSKELRDALGGMKVHKDESYDMLLRRKLAVKRSRRARLKTKLAGFPNLTPGKATRKVLRSDRAVTKDFLEYP